MPIATGGAQKQVQIRSRHKGKVAREDEYAVGTAAACLRRGLLERGVQAMLLVVTEGLDTELQGSLADFIASAHDQYPGGVERSFCRRYGVLQQARIEIVPRRAVEYWGKP